MKKKNSTFNLVVTTVFIGILLSFSIFYLTNMLISPETDTADTCYDGTVITGSDPGSAFRRAVYQSEATLSLIREYQYRLFGIADTDAVVLGEKDFLFEARNDAYDYDFLEDYTGNLRFTDEELEQILAELERRRDVCTQNNASYLLVVIPNSQTVYSEYMPSYLGKISKNTRLSRMESYLNQNGFYDVLDLTDHLKFAKAYGQLYHNTENSLNALGAYYAYLATYNRIVGNVTASTASIAREELDFYRHSMPGLATAQKAGLADLTVNRTVSLSNDMRPNYDFTLTSGLYTTTRLREQESYQSAVLLQFAGSANSSQYEFYFSNTFPQATYQNKAALSKEAFRVSQPQVVVQFIRESELGQLLP